jgi:hypothetical protein
LEKVEKSLGLGVESLGKRDKLRGIKTGKGDKRWTQGL